MNIYQAQTALLSGNEVLIQPSTLAESCMWDYLLACQAYLDGDSVVFKRAFLELSECEEGREAYSLLSVRDSWQEQSFDASRRAFKILWNDFVDQDVAMFWQIESLLMRGVLNVNCRRFDEAISQLEICKQLALQAEAYERAARALYNQCVAFEEIENYFALDKGLCELEAMCRAHELSRVLPLVIRFRSVQLFQQGHYQQACEQIDQGKNLYQDAKWHNDHRVLQEVEARIALRQGSFKAFDTIVKKMQTVTMTRKKVIFKHSVFLLKLAAAVMTYQEQEVKTLIAQVDNLRFDHDDRLRLIQQKMRYDCHFSETSQQRLTSADEISFVEANLIDGGGCAVEDDIALDYYFFQLHHHAQFDNDYGTSFSELASRIDAHPFPYNQFKLKKIALHRDVLAGNLAAVAEKLRQLILMARLHQWRWEELSYLYLYQRMICDVFKKTCERSIRERLHVLQKDCPAGSGYKKIVHLWPFSGLFDETAIRYQFDWKHFEILRGGAKCGVLPKTGMVGKLLQILDRHANRYLSLETLTEGLWQEHYKPDIHNYRLYNLVCSGRQLLQRAGLPACVIVNDPGCGYRLQNFRVTKKTKRKPTVLVEFLKGFKKRDIISSKDLKKALGYSARQAQRDMKLMVDRGWLEPRSDRKSRYYFVV